MDTKNRIIIKKENVKGYNVLITIDDSPFELNKKFLKNKDIYDTHLWIHNETIKKNHTKFFDWPKIDTFISQKEIKKIFE